MEINEKLVLIRAKLDMSQEMLARELNVSFATINRWEKGRTSPSDRYVALINDYCDRKGILHDIEKTKVEDGNGGQKN